MGGNADGGEDDPTDQASEAAFAELVNDLTRLKLSASQLACLQALLITEPARAHCIGLIEQATAGRGCPRCGTVKVHRCGQASGRQRFRCTGCGRSYNALTGTCLARLRHCDRWLDYLNCLLKACTVRDAAHTVAVHRTTSFRWRHRFVTGVILERPRRLCGIVEADETYLLESQKGSRHMTRPARRRGGKAKRPGISREHDCLLVARDRTGQTLDFVTGRGPVTKHQLLRCLCPVLPPDILLISDGAIAYRAFARIAGIAHAYVNLRAGIRVRGTIHVQNVNGWHSRFKRWLIRFHGVASLYLRNYSGWYRMLDSSQTLTTLSWLRYAAQHLLGIVHN